MSLPLNRLRVMETSSNDLISLEDVRLHLRLDTTQEEHYLRAMLAAAGALCERYTGLTLLWTRYFLSLDQWPEMTPARWWDGVREGVTGRQSPLALSLPRPPLLAVNEIRVFDNNNGVIIVPAEDYIIDYMGIPGRILFKEGIDIPLPGLPAGGIEIDYVAGYGTKPDDLPAALKQGILMILAHLYEHRGDTPENALKVSGAGALFQPFRLMRLA